MEVLIRNVPATTCPERALFYSFALLHFASPSCPPLPPASLALLPLLVSLSPLVLAVLPLFRFLLPFPRGPPLNPRTLSVLSVSLFFYLCFVFYLRLPPPRAAVSRGICPFFMYFCNLERIVYALSRFRGEGSLSLPDPVVSWRAFRFYVTVKPASVLLSLPSSLSIICLVFRDERIIHRPIALDMTATLSRVRAALE